MKKANNAECVFPNSCRTGESPAPTIPAPMVSPDQRPAWPASVPVPRAPMVAAGLVLMTTICGVPRALGQCEEQILIAKDAAEFDYTGKSVSVSGDLAVVGANKNDAGFNSGAAYIYRAIACDWQQEARLTASDGAQQDFFGRSVAISGDAVLVGAYADDDAGESSGSAYVYRFDGAD